jgi:NitT/TauT family transport system substrate-binding protein
MEWIPVQKKKKWLLLVVACMIVAMLSACGSSNKEKASNSEETLSFKMGVEPWVGYGPWWIAAEKGIFKKNGLDVTVINFNQDSDINAAFASDKIKVANIATHTAIKMVGNNGLALNGIVLLDESHKADAILSSGIVKSIADLKGKKVAFEEGTTSDLLLRAALKANNMTMDDITVVYMPASDAGLALMSNQVDAAVTYEPYISTVQAKADGIQILYSGEDAPGLISDIAVIKSEYMTAHPEVKEKLKKVWDETMAYWKENQEEGNKILAEKSGIAIADMPVILEGLKYFTSDEQTKLAESGEFNKTAVSIQEILTNQKVLDKQVNIEEMFLLK